MYKMLVTLPPLTTNHPRDTQMEEQTGHNQKTVDRASTVSLQGMTERTRLHTQNVLLPCPLLPGCISSFGVPETYLGNVPPE